jgi:tetratricopeptide (TPR) repeat protein
MQRYADFVLAAKSANGAQALGWYSYNARQFETGAAWFAKALEFEPTEDEALGLAFSYRKLGDRENYARVIDTYRDAYAKIAQLGGRRWTREQRAALESGDAPVRRLRATLTERVSGRPAPQSPGVAGENATGWRLLNQTRPSESAEVFETSLRTAKGRQRQEAAYGRALALLASGKTTEAGRAAESAEMTKRQRNDFGVQLLSTRAWDAYNADRFVEALQWLDQRAAYSSETRDLMQMRVWCLQKLGKDDAASAIQSQFDRQLAP